MKRLRHFFHAIICALLLCSFSVFVLSYTTYAQASDSSSSDFFTYEISILKNQIETYEQNEVEALQALEQAREALEFAIKKDNPEAKEIAGQAVALAEGTLADLRRQKNRVKARLTALEGASGMKDTGKDFGITGIIKGEVLKKTKSGTVQFDKTAPIFAGETLETGADGFLEVAMPDYSYISMGSNTSLELLELDREKKQSLYNFIRREVALGKLYIEHKCYLRGPGECWFTRYRISRGATLAVRGTEFNMEQDEDGSTTIYLFEGTIEVSMTDLDKPVTLKAMEQLVIRQDGSIDGPTPVDVDIVIRWWETGP